MLIERVARLEVRVEQLNETAREMRSDIRDIRDRLGGFGDRLGRLEERVNHLPGKGFIVTVTSTGLALIVALVAIAPKLQALLGVSAP